MGCDFPLGPASDHSRALEAAFIEATLSWTCGSRPSGGGVTRPGAPIFWSANSILRVGRGEGSDGTRVFSSGSTPSTLDDRRSLSGGIESRVVARSGASATLGRLDQSCAKDAARSVLLSSGGVVDRFHARPGTRKRL